VFCFFGDIVQKKPLLDHLVKDAYVSGEDIARDMGISRAAVAKQVASLREKGFIIEASTKRGYKLVVAGDLLDAKTVQALLATKVFARSYRLIDECDSTMRMAADAAKAGCAHGAVFLAERQTAGKGRLGRTWDSPKGTGLYFSIVVRPDLALSEISRLTLVAGASVAEALISSGLTGVSVKWPNDIYVGDKKVCGILTELSAQPEHIEYVVVGVGINVNTPSGALPKTATSLSAHAGKTFARAQVFAAVVASFERAYEAFVQGDFESRRVFLNAYAYLAGRVSVAMPKGSFEGEVKEVDAEGALLVRDDAGVVHRVFSADVMRVRKG
jgi:BirA family biotin operon repressor/biotin-[acetyl-CoA-carboxylase] ligase